MDALGTWLQPQKVATKHPRSTKLEPIQVRFGIALKRARNDVGMSQEALAGDAGLNRSYITEVESGKRNVGLDNAEKLAEAVGKPLWELLKP